MSVHAEILRAVQALGLTPDEFLVLTESNAQEVRARVLAKFVPSGHRRWWWEDFKGAEREVPDGTGWKLPSVIAPDPDARVWFIAEDEQDRVYPVFETTVAHASSVLGECYAFEYYIVAKDLSWLVCENHHNVVMAVGALVEARLAAHAG